MKKTWKLNKDNLFDMMVYAVLLLLSIAIITPFMQILTISMSPSEVVNKFGLHLWPTSFDFSGYQRVFENELVWISYKNTLVRTIVGTGLNVILTVAAAYPLSKKYLPHRSLWTGLIVFTMYFSGGLIPNYLLIRSLKMLNTIYALIIPGMVSAFNLIIVRNFFMAMPESIEESAKIDGAHDMMILLKIVLPLSKPIIATISLWYGVGHWNAWFDSMIYIMDEKKMVLQMILRKIVLEGTMAQEAEVYMGTRISVSPDTVKMATLVVSVIPILCVYPFMQKYFVKGVLIGSLKG